MDGKYSLRSGNNDKQSTAWQSTIVPSYEEAGPSYISTTVPSSTFRTQFASLSLHNSDLIRLLQFPTPACNLVRSVISTRWYKGIQAERDHNGSLEFKLKGNPWSGKSEEAIYSRRFMHSLLGALLEAGWVLSTTADVSGTPTQKSTLLFRHQTPPPASADWMSIAFSRTDRLRFIDAPPGLVFAATQELARFIRGQSKHEDPGTFDLNLKAPLWTDHGSYTMESQRILLALVDLLESQGFTVYASIDQKMTAGGTGTRTDSWHCCRQKGWQMGMPVFHG